MKKEKISGNVIARLPKYLACIEDLHLSSCVRVSSATLSQRLGFTAAQIRQDFACFGEFGQQGYGYNVKKLRYEIREILGLNSRNTAILVGCGNLGKALLNNFDFEACGFFMLAAFDVDEAVIGCQMGQFRVMDARLLERFISVEKPTMAVLTVPKSQACATAELLSRLGVAAIWNFTGQELSLQDTLVENVDFSGSLLALSYKINRKLQPESEDG